MYVLVEIDLLATEQDEKSPNHVFKLTCYDIQFSIRTRSLKLDENFLNNIQIYFVTLILLMSLIIANYLLCLLNYSSCNVCLLSFLSISLSLVN